MTSGELVLAAALGSAFLTAIASLGVEWFREWRHGKADDEAALRSAVCELLSFSLAVAMRARAAGDTMKLRSGIKEDVGVALRLRKLADPLELHDWIARDIGPMNAALADIWTRDRDQEGIGLANDVVDKCMNLLGIATVRQGAEGWERIRVWAAGEQWTPAMTKSYDDAMRDFAHARKCYADHVRARFRLNAVDLFASAEAGDTPKEIEGGTSAPPATQSDIGG